MSRENPTPLRILTSKKPARLPEFYEAGPPKHEVHRRAGGHAHFEELLVMHLDSLYHVALSLTRSTDKAEDLVQETSLKAFRGFGGLEELRNARTGS